MQFCGILDLKFSEENGIFDRYVERRHFSAAERFMESLNFDDSWCIYTFDSFSPFCWRLTWFSQTCNSLTLPVFCACSWSCPGGLFGLFRDFCDLILEFYRSDLCIPEVFLCSSWDTRIVGGFPLPQRFSGIWNLEPASALFSGGHNARHVRILRVDQTQIYQELSNFRNSAFSNVKYVDRRFERNKGISFPPCTCFLLGSILGDFWCLKLAVVLMNLGLLDDLFFRNEEFVDRLAGGVLINLFFFLLRVISLTKFSAREIQKFPGRCTCVIGGG